MFIACPENELTSSDGLACIEKCPSGETPNDKNTACEIITTSTLSTQIITPSVTPIDSKVAFYSNHALKKNS